MTDLYNLPNIRELLTHGFTDAELRALCFDLPGFRPVYDQLAQNTGTAEIVAKLLEHAEKTLQIDTLLALAKEKNPARYEKHQPYYTNNPVPALQRQVASLAQRLALLTLPISMTRDQQYQITLHWAELGRQDSLAHFDLSGADLRAANLSKADLSMANLSNADLRMANLAEANLTEVNLHRAKLNQVDLRGVNLYRSYLKYADLRKANLSGRDTNLTEANLEGTNLSEADLAYANISRVNLRMARLCGTNLRCANLSGANLFKADLKHTDLRGEHLGKYYDDPVALVFGTNPLFGRNSLYSVEIVETDLTSANLGKTNLISVKYNYQTKWPDGFDPVSAGAIRED